MFRRTTTDILRRVDYLCDSVPDGVAAMQALRHQTYNLLIADSKMPGNQHLELLAACGKEVPSLPVIIVTDMPSIETAVKAFRAAAVDYLTKPLDVP